MLCPICNEKMRDFTKYFKCYNCNRIEPKKEKGDG